jgi:hypothetical protein
MFAKPLTVLLAAVVLSAVAWAAFAAKAPVNPDEPITMTKAMYADLLCIAASHFAADTGGVQFNYDPATDAVKAVYLSPTQPSNYARPEPVIAAWKSRRKDEADLRMRQVLPSLQRHVSPSATSVFVGF